MVFPKDYPDSHLIKLKFVRLGEWNLRQQIDCGLSLQGTEICAPPHLDIAALRNVTHENFSPEDPSQFNDIALVELSTEEKFEFIDFIKPICLPLLPEHESIPTTELFEVAGWGNDS